MDQAGCQVGPVKPYFLVVKKLMNSYLSSRKPRGICVNSYALKGGDINAKFSQTRH